MRTCLIFNPTAKGDKARRLQRHFDVIESDCTLKQTYAQGAAHSLAAEAVREGYDIIVAAGGDGTLNEVANGIAEIPDGLEKVKLGVIPLGTVNVFAREVGLPMNLKEAWRTIQQGHSQRIALPEVEFQQDGTTQRRHFIQLAGVGLDARAVELVNWQLKKAVGPLAYIIAGSKALFEKKPHVEINHDEGSLEGVFAMIGNGRFYGGSFPILPDADLEEQQLQVCSLPGLGISNLFHGGIASVTGFKKRIAGASYPKSKELTLTATPTTPVQVDGEAIGHTPARFYCSGKTVEIIIPKRVSAS